MHSDRSPGTSLHLLGISRDGIPGVETAASPLFWLLGPVHHELPNCCRLRAPPCLQWNPLCSPAALPEVVFPARPHWPSSKPSRKEPERLMARLRSSRDTELLRSRASPPGSGAPSAWARPGVRGAPGLHRLSWAALVGLAATPHTDTDTNTHCKTRLGRAAGRPHTEGMRVWWISAPCSRRLIDYFMVCIIWKENV